MDLPPRSLTTEAKNGYNWISDLNPSESFPLSYAGLSSLTSPLLHTFGLKFEDGTIRDGTACQPQALPRSRVYTVPGHYEKILLKADLADMLTWAAVTSETNETSMLADAITMTSFAVTKSDYRDRLIGWPRIQNLLFCRHHRLAYRIHLSLLDLESREKGN